MRASGLSAPCALGAVAAAAFFARTHDYALLGWDSYPILASSRVRSLGDLVACLSSELMDGRYPGGDFYRPLLSLSFALDHALFGLSPAGYQLTNALVLGAFVALVYALARRATAPRPGVAPLGAALVLALHPTLIEVVPVPARRPELLCGAFLAAALLAQLAPRALAARRPPLLPAVLGALAFASKEAGAAAPALAFAAVLLFSPRAGARARLRHASLALVPHAAGFALLLGVRVTVLGGLGGHRELSTLQVVAGAPIQLFLLLQQLVAPPYVVAPGPLATALAAALGAGLALATRRRGADAPAPGAAPARAIALGAAWVVLLALTYAPGGRFEPWYAPLVAAGYALALGAAAEALRGAARQRRRSRWLPAAAGLAALAAAISVPARYSPLLRAYPDWERASAASDAFLRDLARRIERAPAGARVAAPPLPERLPRRRDRPAVQGGAVLAAYSVEAWAALAFPARRVRVTPPGVEPPRVVEGEIQVVLPRRRRGF